LGDITQVYDYNTSRSIIVGLVLLVGLFILTPRFFDPSGNGESEKQWVAARVLGDTGGFPEFSLVLYILLIFGISFICYPLSVRLEYIITHVFAHAAFI